MSIEFLITAFVVVIAPGTGVVYTVAIGLARGRWMSVAAAIGCTLGIAPAMAASVFGVASILHASAVLFQIVKFAGVAYLLYLAWMTLRDSGPVSLSRKDAGDETGFWRIARTGTLINVLNPKLTLFFMAFLPQFIDPATGAIAGQMLTLGSIFMVMTFLVFVLYGAFAALIGAHVLARPAAMAWVRRGVAATFAAFGARLALAER